jgi:putative membrane protein
MLRFLAAWIINAIALVVAAWLLPGITFTDWVAVVITALIVGLVNALIRPLVLFVTCCVNVITLGLFTLVVNALMLWFAGWIAQQLNVGFFVDGFIPAFLGAIIISLVSFVLNLVFGFNRRPEQVDTRRDRW